MSFLLEKYLNKLSNELDKILSMYKKIVVYDKIKDIKKGLLRFDVAPKNTVFLFILPKEELLEFHTIGMKFPINIYFFNSQKELVSKYKNVKPGIELVSSKKPSKYVIEEIFYEN